MTDIIKTWPAFMRREKVERLFAYPHSRFYFSLGRGRPKRIPSNLWFTHRGQILGSLPIEAIRQNDGTMPKLRSLSDHSSEWQFKHDLWIAICIPPIKVVPDKVFHDSFRGWRYFDFDSYRLTPDASFSLDAQEEGA